MKLCPASRTQRTLEISIDAIGFYVYFIKETNINKFSKKSRKTKGGKSLETDQYGNYLHRDLVIIKTKEGEVISIGDSIAVSRKGNVKQVAILAKIEKREERRPVTVPFMIGRQTYNITEI